MIDAVEGLAPHQLESEGVVLALKRAGLVFRPNHVDAGDLRKDGGAVQRTGATVAMLPRVSEAHERGQKVRRIPCPGLNEEVEVDVIPVGKPVGGEGAGQRDATNEGARGRKIPAEGLSNPQVLRLEPSVGAEASFGLLDEMLPAHQSDDPVLHDRLIHHGQAGGKDRDRLPAAQEEGAQLVEGRCMPPVPKEPERCQNLFVQGRLKLSVDCFGLREQPRASVKGTEHVI